MLSIVWCCLLFFFQWTLCLGQDPVCYSCACDVPNKGFIDLTSLANPEGSPPKFSGITDGEFEYSYNPCYGFRQGDPGTACNGNSGEVAACQTNTDTGDSYNLGDPNTEAMYVDSDTDDVFVQYDGGQEGRITKVYLKCEQNADTPSLVANGDNEVQLTYVFHLTTKCACPGACGDDTPSPPTGPTGPTNPGESRGSGHGVSVGYIGIIIMILLLAAIVTYFVAGAIVLKFKYERTGADVIPQKNYWFELPILVKDGFVFTFKPLVTFIKNKTGRGGGESYEMLK